MTTIGTDPFASYKLLARALRKKNYHMEFDMMPPATATYVSPFGASWVTKAAHIAYPFNNERIRDVSINKEKAYGFAVENAFQVPYTLNVTAPPRPEEAQFLFDRYTRLIVKPANSSLGRGLTLNVTTYNQLIKAIAQSQVISPHTLIQEQVEGEELRFTVVKGKVEAILLRQTARVIGDGVRTVADLIKHENEQRRAIKCEYITYPQLDDTLVDPALSHSTHVLAEGEVVELNRSTMIRGGCSVYNITDMVHQSYIQKVEALIAKLDPGFMVVDVFCKDYTAPAAADNYWLIEFNTAPALKLYYACRDGKQYDIVSQLADMIDASLKR